MAAEARGRTFVALRCGAAVRRRLEREIGRLALLDRGLRPTRPDDFHLTLQFLGDTAMDEVPAISQALRSPAASTGPVPVRYRGLGAFPSAERARVVWVGVQDTPPGSLALLAAATSQALQPLGFAPATKSWSAHVTLGRLNRLPGRALVQAIGAGGSLDLGEEVLSDLKLILSRPQEGRYHYIDLTTWPLSASPSEPAPE